MRSRQQHKQRRESLWITTAIEEQAAAQAEKGIAAAIEKQVAAQAKEGVARAKKETAASGIGEQVAAHRGVGSSSY